MVLLDSGLSWFINLHTTSLFVLRNCADCEGWPGLWFTPVWLHDKDKRGRSWKKPGRADVWAHLQISLKKKKKKNDTYWLSLIDIYIHNLLANCCWYIERNWQAFIVAILWFFIWNTFDAIIKHLKLNSKMHGGHFSLCIWNVHTWAMEERWMPIYHFLPFWKLFHTLCVVLTWFVHTDWWAVTRVLCVCACTACSQPLCTGYNMCVNVCLTLCVSRCVCVWSGWVCFPSCLEGKPDPMWPCVSPAALGSEQPALFARRPAGWAQTLFTLLFLDFLFRIIIVGTSSHTKN